eukprot:scaffold5640_cov182-Ochromonas_danica.AAC.3
MSSRSLLLELPRDILHSVYSEWLSSWRDLSCLDVGCVGEGDREAWLCSLSEVKMRNRLAYRVLSDESMRMWYEWVISRKVLVAERFPVWLSVFANLATELDFGSYCPALRSIDIVNDISVEACPVRSNELSVLEERLDLFVRQCVCLKEVSIDCGVNSDVRDLVLSVLTKGLEVNTLQSVCIKVCTSISTSTVNMIRQLLANHLTSIHDLEFSYIEVSEESIDRIMSILQEKPTHLKKLCLCIDHISLLQVSRYLSSGGVTMHLEVLSIEKIFVMSKEDFTKGEILLHLGSACPRLRTLTVNVCGVGSYQTFNQFPVTKLLQLYESCPNLISVKCLFGSSFSIFIEVDEEKRELRYNTGPICRYSTEKKAVFLECLRLAIQRSKYKLAVSNYSFCDNLVTQYDEWVLFKSKLSPYLTDLVGKMTESILIEAVKDLPRLEKLSVYLGGEEKFSDLSLAAIMQYGCGLQSLSVNAYSECGPVRCSFSDEMISKVITSCKMLEVLKILGAGQGSVLAVKHHSRLREVYLDEVRVGKEDLSTLLCVDEREGEEKYVWRRLSESEISGRCWSFNYNKEKRCWE